MRTRLLGIAVLWAGLVLLTSKSHSKASFEETQRRESANNPSDVRFVLRTNQSRYHPGEIIRLTLEFSSTNAGKYLLNGATYDRSGRLPTEQFFLDGDDVADPFSDFFGSGVLGSLGGGLRSNPVLGLEPHRIELALNDWFRFDKPGRYRLFLKSHRLSRARLPGEDGDGLVQFGAVSNILEIEITGPDPAWESAKLREIQTAFEESERSSRDDAPVLPGAPQELQKLLVKLPKGLDAKAREAEQELRYLGTRDAIRFMFSQAHQNEGDVDTLGLIGSPHRAFLISEMDRYISDPDSPVTAWIIRLRTLLDFVAKHPRPLPTRVWELHGGNWEPVQKEAEKRRQEFDEMLHKRAVSLIALPDLKSPRVREQCIDALAELAPDEVRAAKLIPPDDFGLTREQLLAQFESLTDTQQSELLSAKWDLVSGPEMIPILRRIALRSAAKDLPEAALAFSLWHGPISVNEQALQRLLELAPDEAKKLMIDDLARDQHRFAAFSVNVLPPGEIAEAETSFKKALGKNPSQVMPLVAKFGTGALADQVRTAYQNRDWPCEEEKWFLVYFLRTDLGEGKQALALALANREQRGCHHFLLGQLAYVLWTKEIEQQAIASLNDKDPETAADAARALPARGGPEVEHYLWSRLESWNEKWKGRVSHLKRNPITGADPSNGDSRLGDALYDAIYTGRAWFFDLERKHRLTTLCLGDLCQDRWPVESSVRVEVANGSPYYGPNYKVAQYLLQTMDDLKAKLTQFPTETVFRWCPQGEWNPSDSFTPNERQQMYNELAGFLAKRSMRIEPYSKESCGQ